MLAVLAVTSLQLEVFAYLRQFYGSGYRMVLACERVNDNTVSYVKKGALPNNGNRMLLVARGETMKPVNKNFSKFCSESKDVARAPDKPVAVLKEAAGLPTFLSQSYQTSRHRKVTANLTHSVTWGLRKTL
jgi:hypothetical protein